MASSISSNTRLTLNDTLYSNTCGVYNTANSFYSLLGGKYITRAKIGNEDIPPEYLTYSQISNEVFINGFNQLLCNFPLFLTM